jgi:hypothetical protein
VAGKGGISGVAVTMVSAGAYLVYAGINDVPLLPGLRSLVKGEKPKGSDRDHSASWTLAGYGTDGGSVLFGTGGTSPTGSALVSAARKYLGVPYRWGGNTPSGLDCSGLVQLSFRDIGVPDCPRTSLQQSQWRKVRKVSAPAAGDLLWKPGHIAIATGPSSLIEAPKPGDVVSERAIYSGFKLYLRYVPSAPTSTAGRTRAV